MFSDSLRYLFNTLKKERFFLLRSEESYDPVEREMIGSSKKVPIKVIELCIDSDNLPSECLSTDRMFNVLTKNIDKTDKLKDKNGIEYVIMHLDKICFKPSTYEVIVRAN